MSRFSYNLFSSTIIPDYFLITFWTILYRSLSVAVKFHPLPDKINEHDTFPVLFVSFECQNRSTRLEIGLELSRNFTVETAKLFSQSFFPIHSRSNYFTIIRFGLNQNRDLCIDMIMKSVRYARKRKARQTALVPRHKWAEGHHRFGNGSTKPRSIHARVTLIYFSAHDRALDHEPRCATAKPFVSSSS